MDGMSGGGHRRCVSCRRLRRNQRKVLKTVIAGINSDHYTPEELILRPKACNLPAAELQSEPNVCWFAIGIVFGEGRTVKGIVEERAVEPGEYIVQNKTAVRSAAKKVSKSTVHTVVT